MSKDNHSRIPMRGFSSRIPMPGSSSTQSSTPTQSQNNQKFVTPKTKLAPTKLTRPTDIPLSNFVRPAIVTQKITQITKSSLSNLTSRILTRQFSANNEQQQKSTEMSSQSKELQEMQNKTHDVHENDQMLIDETIDLVGSDDNVNRYASKESIQNHLQQQSIINPPPNATFDINRRDGTFIKSPTRGPSAIGSVNSLPDTKETPTNSAKRAVSKSRDSLNSIQVSNQTRVIHLRKSGNDFDGSSLSLTKSPDWGSEDMLIDSPIDMNGCVFNSTLITEERLVEVTAMRPFFNNDTFINATQLLCMTPVDKSNNNKPQAMEVDECDATITNFPMRINDNTQVDPQKRYSFGLDITECTLDCSIELCDISMSSTMLKTSPVEKQGSFDVDESLGILTPDQMKEFLDSTNTNHTNNLELPLIPGHKLSLQCRIDQTPSPEELPLDPVGVKMEEIIQQPIQQQISTSVSSHQEISVSQAESDPKTDMTKSATSKVSNSIITSVTSITSLDTGYIGDGENSRPASRGAADQSPSKVPRNEQPPNWNQVAQPQQQAAAAVHRQRQDPMTDSDFFTESDADDIFHQRENQRRAQVIDGQLYGPMLQGANVIFQQQPQESDSCMESSGVFTDVENRGDDELLNRLAENAQHHANDMSPDLSSDTITSSGTACSQKKLHTTTPSPTQQHHHNHHSIDRPREFINETSSSICSMMMDECAAINETNVGETINLISDASLGSTKLCVEDAEVNVCDTNNRNNISSSSKKTVTSVSAKKTIGSSRKTHKNETNFGLKKHEMSSRGSSTIKTNDKTQSSAKKNLNGKWEPVMNKIAENKNVKKNFDNVKSKVTCGAVKRTITTGSLKTPPSDDHSIVSTESTGAIAKRNAGVKDSSSSGNKRGRAFSKDSQESSQSDLSLNGASTASPKIIKSSATRSAKKRDVRTISSSPSDLGPPSKTITNNAIQRGNARNITVSQKRTSPQQIIASTTPNNHIDQLKASPPAKKTTIQRRGILNGSPQQQHKDHNSRLAQQPPSVVNGSPRNSLRSNHSSKAATPPPSNRSGLLIDSLSVSPKSKVKELENNNNNKIINKNSTNVNKTQQEQQLLQKIIDQQTIENQKQMMELSHANKGVEALGALVQYLVYNLDAFSCPSIKKAQQKTAKQLLEARDCIDEMKSSYQSLEEKLNDREEYFSKREIELQDFHRCEMLKAQKSLEDLQNEKTLQERLIAEIKAENELKIKNLALEAEKSIKSRDEELQSAKNRENDLLRRIQQLTVTEDELRDKVHSSELEFSEKLQNAMMKERELTEKINQLTKDLDDLKTKSESEKRELEEKLNLSQDELSIIRNSRSNCANESFHNRSSNNTSLQDEVESLRCVLELKQSEISELRKTNCELQRAADEATSAQFRCSALESRIEDLQVQLHAKNEEEKELMQKYKALQEQHENATLKTSRLSLHNEELLWRLKQNAEKYTMTLNELSKSYHESSSTFNRTNMNINEFDISCGAKSSNSSTLDAENCGGSPPPSPIIKGVVEKSDSVSWVLEMDDETPEVLATRLVRRAGSFRSDKCSPSPVPKRQKCQNNTSIQQSASATSILKQHSEPSPMKQATNGRLRSKSVSATKANEPQQKMIPQIVRSISNNGGAVVKNLNETAWKHNSLNQMKTSSPNPKNISVSETSVDLIIDEDFENVAGKNDFFLNDGAGAIKKRESFHRDTAPNFKKSRENRGLITCDTAALTGNELKTHRRPKASAGEIKFSVSGSNSEDEEEIDEEQSVNSSSASSTVSTSPSTPSMSSTSTSSSSNVQPIESIEDALLRWKEHNNTPMEVSWCDGEPSESCV